MKIATVTRKNKRGEESTTYRISFYVAGKKRFKQFKTEQAAQRFIKRDLATVIKTGAQEAELAKTPLLNDVADAWLKACKNGRGGEPPLEPETIRTYTGYVENWIKPQMKDKRVGALTRKECYDFRKHLVDASIARITAKKILTAFKSILAYAIEIEEIENDPSAKITIKLGKRYTSPIAIHTKAEMARILTKARELVTQSNNKQTIRTWKRYALMLEILVYCGLRLSELRGLPRVACDTKHAKLKVIQRADRVGRIGPPKSARGYRTLDMPDILCKHLQDWLDESPPHDLVFASRTGMPLFPENIAKRMWEHILLVAEAPKYNLHSTRHFFASRLIEDGIDVKELSVVMGHADEAFTLRTYGHLFNDPESQARRRRRANRLVLTPESSGPSESASDARSGTLE